MAKTSRAVKHKPVKPRPPEGIRIEILRCVGPCGGKKALSLVDDDDQGSYRLTSHKCGGGWHRDQIFEIDDSAMDALAEAIGKFRKANSDVV